MKKLILTFSLLLISLFSNAQNCAAGFTYVDQGGGTIQFFDTSYMAPGSSAAFWLWSFGDGSTSTQQNPTHTYTTDGSKTVTLNVTSSTFCNSSTNNSVNVTGTSGGNNCDASFTYLDMGTGMNDYSFTPNNPNPNPLATHHWDFGDGSTDSVLLTIHTFLNPGTYNVCYIVADPIQGCADTTCQMVSIISTHVNNTKSTSIKVYPTVFQNNLTIEYPEGMNANNILLVDILGNAVASEKILSNGNKTTLNTTNISSGVYFIRLQNGKESFAMRVIKN